MAKPTTIRIPEDLINEINEFVQELNLDRSAYLREVLRKGFSMDKQDRLILKYVRKELSQMEVCKELNWDPWEFFAQLKARPQPWFIDSLSLVEMFFLLREGAPESLSFRIRLNNSCADDARSFGSLVIMRSSKTWYFENALGSLGVGRERWARIVSIGDFSAKGF